MGCFLICQNNNNAISTQLVYLQRWYGWCDMKLLPSWRVLCTLYNHAPSHFMQSHIRKAYACSAVTCHLHFWQNVRDLLHATVSNSSGTDTGVDKKRVDDYTQCVLEYVLLCLWVCVFVCVCWGGPEGMIVFTDHVCVCVCVTMFGILLWLF